MSSDTRRKATVDRQHDVQPSAHGPNDPYVKSFHLVRTAVGLIGIALPIYLIIGERILDDLTVEVRGSISAYYHSSMNDVFVGALSVIAFLLIMYRSSEFTSREFWREAWLSLGAGAALILLVYFPTERPDIPAGAPECGPDVDPVPLGCAPIQTFFGERPVAIVHFVSAAAFIGLLAWICSIFARREAKKTEHHDPRPARARLHWACFGAMVLAVAWIGIGKLLNDQTIFGLKPLYVGELVSVWAFAVSWLIKGKDLFAALRAGVSSATAAIRKG